MSPVAAPARRAAGRQAPRPAPRPAPRLRVVAPVPSRAPRAPFVLFSMLLVGAGLVSLLLLNTVVAQDAFTLHDLERGTAALQQREQRLLREVAALEAPAALADRAAKIGLVPAGDPVFVAPDGRVLGNPRPATAPPAPVVAAPASPKPAPAAQPSAKGSPDPKPSPSVKGSAAPKPSAKPRASARPSPSRKP